MQYDRILKKLILNNDYMTPAETTIFGPRGTLCPNVVKAQYVMLHALCVRVKDWLQTQQTTLASKNI